MRNELVPRGVDCQAGCRGSSRAREPPASHDSDNHGGEQANAQPNQRRPGADQARRGSQINPHGRHSTTSIPKLNTPPPLCRQVWPPRNGPQASAKQLIAQARAIDHRSHAKAQLSSSRATTPVKGRVAVRAWLVDPRSAGGLWFSDKGARTCGLSVWGGSEAVASGPWFRVCICQML
jgi:hypothetical protein